MPNASKKLPDAVIADFETWIAMGGPDPRDGKSTARKGVDYDEGRRHWSYQAVRVKDPSVKEARWAKTGIDRYLLAKLESKGLRPNDDALPHAILRRLSFAIIGLPPTPEESISFEKAHAANADDAIRTAVDRLLDSPRFGEYWARHWMDGVRYDQQAQSIDRYVDWLVRAFNQDMPYDRFIAMQLAGDLLPATGSKQGDDDRLVATQLLTLNLGEMDVVEGCIEVTGQQFLGLSINCAKCHDHKFDAFSQADYYALAGIFTSTDFAGSRNSKAFPKGIQLQSEAGMILCLQEGKAADTNLLIRGERSQRGPVIERRFPIVLAGDKQRPLSAATKGSGRQELAQWIASADNPLTARVMANRVWDWFVGQPLVGTPSDFGVQGERPTHPELLDYLADRFVKQGWSIKALIREIATSRVLRVSSRASDSLRTGDPDNNHYTRMPLRRLDAEQLADAIYYSADRLVFERPPFNLRLAGRGAPPVDASKKNNDAVRFYRAVYGLDQTYGKLFDMADPDLLTVRRDSSVTAPQMLYFLNNGTVAKMGAAVAKLASGATAEAKVEAAYRRLLGRSPTAEEVALSTAFVDRQGLEKLCHLLLCSSEFSYLE